MGQRADRYDGAGYGNVSGRVGPYPGARGRRAFVVSGSQTGGKECVRLEDFVLVRRYDATANEVVSEGLMMPSSESMTHGAIYDLAPHIRYVFHVHCPLIWRAAPHLGLPFSNPAVPYGTPEMAREITRLAREEALLERGVMAMGGHEDGVIAFGRTPGAAGSLLMGILATAHQHAFRQTGSACGRDGASRRVERP